MAATSTTESWDAAWTLTMRAKRKRLTDNISDDYPTLDTLRPLAETESGGKEIQEDLLYGLNSGTWFDGYDTVGHPTQWTASPPPSSTGGISVYQ